jgi:hypothetical protein
MEAQHGQQAVKKENLVLTRTVRTYSILNCQDVQMQLKHFRTATDTTKL